MDGLQSPLPRKSLLMNQKIGFVNFMNENRSRTNRINLPSVIQRIKIWKNLSDKDKHKYEMKSQKQDLETGEDEEASCSMKRKDTRGPKKPECMKRKKARCSTKPKRSRKKAMCISEPLNGYLRYLRIFRRKHCEMDPKKILIRAARAWSRLTACQRERYKRRRPKSCK